MKTKPVVLLLCLLALSFLNYAQIPDFVLKTEKGNIRVEKFSEYYFCLFNLDKPSGFSLFSKLEIGKAQISPGNLEIPVSHSGKYTLEFTLEKAGHYLVRINDSLKVFLFAEVPEIIKVVEIYNIVDHFEVDNTGTKNDTRLIQKALDEIPGTGKILYFPPGKYKATQLHISSNSKIHIAQGAILFTDTSSVQPFLSDDEVETRRFIYLKNVENVEITGHGTIESNGNIMRRKYGDDARFRLMLAVKCRNIKVDGLMMKNPGSWNTQVIACNDVEFRNVKLLNDVRLANTDGFDPDASSNVLIEDCFAVCGDDNVAVKVTGKGELAGNVEDVTVKGNIFLTRKSALKVGTETRAVSMKHIIFENNDVLECDRGMAVYVRDGAAVDSVFYLNNRFERNFPDAQQKLIHFEVDKRNEDSKLGSLKHILIKDNKAYEVFPKQSEIISEQIDSVIDVTIENLVIKNKKVMTSGETNIKSVNAEIIFK